MKRCSFTLSIIKSNTSVALTYFSFSFIYPPDCSPTHHRFTQVNFLFLLNIVRVLITKLKGTHCAESTAYMKAVRATLILIPLLGVQFVLLPWRPGGRISRAIYDFFVNIFSHFQVKSIANWTFVPSADVIETPSNQGGIRLDLTVQLLTLRGPISLRLATWRLCAHIRPTILTGPR